MWRQREALWGRTRCGDSGRHCGEGTRCGDSGRHCGEAGGAAAAHRQEPGGVAELGRLDLKQLRERVDETRGPLRERVFLCGLLLHAHVERVDARRAGQRARKSTSVSHTTLHTALHMVRECEALRQGQGAGTAATPGQRQRFEDLGEREDVAGGPDHLGSSRIVASENKGTKNVSESGVKWVSGRTKRQCDRALRPPSPRAGRAAGTTCAAAAEAAWGRAWPGRR